MNNSSSNHHEHALVKDSCHGCIGGLDPPAVEMMAQETKKARVE